MMDGFRIFLAYIVPAVLVAGCAAMFIRLTGNLRKLNAKIDRTGEDLRSELDKFSRSLEGVKGEMQPLLEAQAVPSPADAGGMDTAIRSKVLKMHRLGRSADQIAASLRRSKGEVTMLLKVHAILMQSFERQAESPETFLEQKA